MSRMGMRAAGLMMGMALAAGQAMAADAESCKKVRLSDVGWTDIQVTTATTAAGAERVLIPDVPLDEAVAVVAGATPGMVAEFLR